MFADSSGKFQVNVPFPVKLKSGSIFQMDGRKAKRIEFIFADLDDALERRKLLTRLQPSWRRKALPNKTLDKF